MNVIVLSHPKCTLIYYYEQDIRSIYSYCPDKEYFLPPRRRPRLEKILSSFTKETLLMNIEKIFFLMWHCSDLE